MSCLAKCLLCVVNGKGDVTHIQNEHIFIKNINRKINRKMELKLTKTNETSVVNVKETLFLQYRTVDFFFF